MPIECWRLQGFTDEQFYKAKATATPINGTEDDYATFTIDCKGVFTAYKFTNEQKLVDIVINKTITDLAAVVGA